MRHLKQLKVAETRQALNICKGQAMRVIANLTEPNSVANIVVHQTPCCITTSKSANINTSLNNGRTSCVWPVIPEPRRVCNTIVPEKTTFWMIKDDRGFYKYHRILIEN